MQIFPDYSRGYSQYDPSTEIPDLKGKVAIVTGGKYVNSEYNEMGSVLTVYTSSGIGYETVKWLAMKGAKVYLGARDESRGKSAVEKINQSIAGHFSAGSVHWLELDVETPRRAKAGAQRFLAQETRLDILISNAGVNLPGYHTASEGGLTFNKVMSINHLGPFVLTQELLPILKRTAAEPHSDVRLIVVSSWMYKDVAAKPDFRTLAGWNAINGDGVINSNKRYVASKLANVLFVKELQSRIDAENVPITCLAINPGLVNTGVHHKSFPAGIITVLLDWVFEWFGLTSEQGSFASLFAATSPEIKALPEKWKGAYMEPYNRWTETGGFSQDKQLAKDLWACSEEVSEACLRDG